MQMKCKECNGNKPYTYLLTGVFENIEFFILVENKYIDFNMWKYIVHFNILCFFAYIIFVYVVLVQNPNINNVI